MDKSKFLTPFWISQLDKSKLVLTKRTSLMEKSIYACIYANIWVNQICAYMHAKMDFSDGEIIFVVPVWISPF